MATYNVGGFTFTNEAEAKRAKQELQAIENIKSRTNISNPAIAKQILYTCKTKGAFKTKVGTDFLNKLQQTAKSSVDNKQFNKSVNNTPVNKRVTLADMENNLAHEEANNQKNSELKKRIFIISAVTVLSVVIIYIFNTFSISNHILGHWERVKTGGSSGSGVYSVYAMRCTYDFDSDKSFNEIIAASVNSTFGRPASDVVSYNGKYEISGNKITLTYDNGDVTTYKIKIVNNQLFLENKDNDKYIYQRQ